jgi:hypothetical protein
VIACQGLKGAIPWIKLQRNRYLQYLAASPGSLEERKLQRKLRHVWTHRGAAALLKKSPPEIRMVLTALTALRSFTLPVVVDVGPIVSPSSQTDCGSWKQWVGPFWDLLSSLRRVPNSSSLDWREFHFSLKAGPSGGPALFGATSDLASLPESLIADLKVLGGKLFEDVLNGALEALSLVRPVETTLFKIKENKTIRRITGIPDKEGKTRVIAVLDYWSQTVLRPLHF